MKRQQVTRNNQQSKNEIPLVKGILQRSAVSQQSDDVQAKDDHEAQALMNSAFSQDYSRVPITATKPQQLPILNPPRHLMPPIQAKLTIGQPGDKYEQEADRVASQVVKQINAPASAQSNQGKPIQRQEELEEEIQTKLEITALQRREAIGGGETATDLESAINDARGSGKPLEAGLRQSIGLAMGADLSGVRVHTDSRSDMMNRIIKARAFTTGQDVFFRKGAYDPGSRRGEELIAHECCHVVQQCGGAGVTASVGRASLVVQRMKITDAHGIETDIPDDYVQQKGSQKYDVWGDPKDPGTHWSIAKVKGVKTHFTQSEAKLENKAKSWKNFQQEQKKGYSKKDKKKPYDRP